MRDRALGNPLGNPLGLPREYGSGGLGSIIRADNAPDDRWVPADGRVLDDQRLKQAIGPNAMLDWFAQPPLLPDVQPTSVTSLSLSQDGEYLAATSSSSPYLHTFKVTDVGLTKLASPPSMPPGQAQGCAFSPDGTHLAVVFNGAPYVRIYKRSGDTFTALPNPSALPRGNWRACSFSGDGAYLAVAGESSDYVTKIVLYKREGDVFTEVSASLSAINTLAACVFSPDSKHLVVGEYSSVRVLKRSGDTFSLVFGLSKNVSGPLNGLAFSPDGSHVAVAHSRSPFISVFQLTGDTLTEVPIPPIELGADQTATSCAYSPDGRLLLVGTTGVSEVIFEINNGMYRRSAVFTSGGVQRYSISQDGGRVAISDPRQAVSVRQDIQGVILPTLPYDYFIKVK